ncbi:hypothetical protein CAOG_010116 [Capsaspora owczarzaki ATCC 30864]|uniref:Uncharacterized protein n=1 Tax=Capsaspora owczarzaki (strain ATCC 30864) TaxID=595528 RepID=A0A0D2WX73_CAPO3|nr:hypothetical protein CAOG_010116 [Capsaspora owczarzaki ATCC 30864]
MTRNQHKKFGHKGGGRRTLPSLVSVSSLVPIKKCSKRGLHPPHVAVEHTKNAKTFSAIDVQILLTLSVGRTRVARRLLFGWGSQSSDAGKTASKRGQTGGEFEHKHQRSRCKRNDRDRRQPVRAVPAVNRRQVSERKAHEQGMGCAERQRHRAQLGLHKVPLAPGEAGADSGLRRDGHADQQGECKQTGKHCALVLGALARLDVRPVDEQRRGHHGSDSVQRSRAKAENTQRLACAQPGIEPVGKRLLGRVGNELAQCSHNAGAKREREKREGMPRNDNVELEEEQVLPSWGSASGGGKVHVANSHVNVGKHKQDETCPQGRVPFVEELQGSTLNLTRSNQRACIDGAHADCQHEAGHDVLGPRVVAAHEDAIVHTLASALCERERRDSVECLDDVDAWHHALESLGVRKHVLVLFLDAINNVVVGRRGNLDFLVSQQAVCALGESVVASLVAVSDGVLAR